MLQGIFRTDPINQPDSQIPQCTRPISHNAPFRTEILSPGHKCDNKLIILAQHISVVESQINLPTSWMSLNTGFFICMIFAYLHIISMLVLVWDDIFTPTISLPRGENIVTIFSPPLRYFHPLTISNGKSFCSQISLNLIMCIYNMELFYTFYDFLQIFFHHRLLIQSINI